MGICKGQAFKRKESEGLGDAWRQGVGKKRVSLLCKSKAKGTWYLLLGRNCLGRVDKDLLRLNTQYCGCNIDTTDIDKRVDEPPNIATVNCCLMSSIT